MSLPNKWRSGELKPGSDSRDTKGLPGQRVLSLTLRVREGFFIFTGRCGSPHRAAIARDKEQHGRGSSGGEGVAIARSCSQVAC
jgi:hypothetical protein